MENVSEDPFSSFLKNEMKQLSSDESRFDAAPQNRYDYEADQSGIADSLFKNDYQDPLVEDVPLNQPPFQEGVAWRQREPEKEFCNTTAAENPPEAFPFPATQSFPPAPLPMESTIQTMTSKRPPSSPPCKSALKGAKRPMPGKGRKCEVDWKDDDSSSESLSRCDVDKKKKRLERNRKSARESRRRKKEYILSLENQNNELRHELAYYKTELAKHVPRKGSGSPGRIEIPAMPIPNTDFDGSEGMQNPGLKLLEQVRSVKEAMEQLVNSLIPSLHKYMIWSAETGTDFYNNMFNMRPTEEETKSPFFMPSNSSSDNIVIKLKDGERRNGLAEIIGELQLNGGNLRRIAETQTQVRQIGTNVRESLKRLLECKNSILGEVGRLDRLLRDELYSQMSREAVEKFNHWIEQVPFRVIICVQKQHTAELEYFAQMVLKLDGATRDSKDASFEGEDDASAAMWNSSSPIKRPKIFQ